MTQDQILDIHPLLSDRVRLAIMATLISNDQKVDFTTLVNLLKLTRGNLSVHARKLEEGGFIKIEKKFIDRKPQTLFQASQAGKKEFNRYLTIVERFIKEVKK